MDSRRSQMTKRLLGESLLRLMREKPIEQITVTELCREADINRTTFYRYYTVPGDILPDVQGMINTQYEKALTGKADRLERLVAALHTVRQHSDRAVALNNAVNQIIADAPDAEQGDLFYQLLASCVPAETRIYARRLTSVCMTLWLESGCAMEDRTFAEMLIGICGNCADAAGNQAGM